MNKMTCGKLCVFSMLFVLVFATSARATTLGYTDWAISEGNPITYTLEFGLLSGSTYDATFSITNFANVSPEKYGGFFLFKLDGATGATISDFSMPGWSVLNPGDTASILWAGGGNNILTTKGGHTGFYLDALTVATYTDGVLLTGDPSTTIFNFRFTLPGEANLELVDIKVGYYGSFDTLNADLTVVPEPTSLLLLGSGLAGLGALRRGSGRAWRRLRNGV